MVKAAGSKRLTLKCDEPLLKFAFNFNMRRCIAVALEGRGLNSSTFRLNVSTFYGILRVCGRGQDKKRLRLS